MRIQGLVHPEKDEHGLHFVEIPGFEIFTQGTSFADGKEMALDVVQCILGDDQGNLPCEISLVGGEGGTFSLEFSDPRVPLSLLLRALRLDSGKSLQELARSLGMSSKNAVHQYETGRGPEPTSSKMQEMVAALGYDLVIGIAPRVAPPAVPEPKRTAAKKEKVATKKEKVAAKPAKVEKRIGVVGRKLVAAKPASRASAPRKRAHG